MKKFKKHIILAFALFIMAIPVTVYAAHKHTDSCYKITYHSHSEGCYDSLTHKHTEDCYDRTYHSHVDACYECKYHTHSDSCYETVYHEHDGNASSGGGCYTPVYHSHTDSCYSIKYHSHSGNATSGGGCYTPEYHSHTDSCYDIKYHTHSGNATSGGGCYGKQVTKSETVKNCQYETSSNWTSNCCGASMSITVHHYKDGSQCGIGTCPKCGQRVSGMGGEQPESKTETVTYYEMNCGKTNGQEVSRTIKCGKTEQTVEKYNLTCGKTEQTVESQTEICGKTTSTVEKYNLTCGKTTSTVESTKQVCGKTDGELESKKIICGKTEQTIEKEKLICGVDNSNAIFKKLNCGKDENTIESKVLICKLSEEEEPSGDNPGGGEDDKKNPTPTPGSNPKEDPVDDETEKPDENVNKPDEEDDEDIEEEDVEEEVEEEVEKEVIEGTPSRTYGTISQSKEKNYGNRTENMDETENEEKKSFDFSILLKVLSWILKIGALGAVVAGAIIFLPKLLSKTINVYEYVESENDFALLFKKGMKKGKNGYTVVLKETDLDKTDSTKLQIEIPEKLLSACIGEYLFVQLPDEELEFEITDNTVIFPIPKQNFNEE